jgi:hypothetical protein
MEGMNDGVILGKKEGDWVGGTIPYEVRNPSGNWDASLPPGEWQKFNSFETMACVTYSALNSIETQLKFLQGWTPNFSDRYIAKMSGTTPQGNHLWKVADTIRLEGLVLESEWPTPPSFSWDTYYAEVPETVKAKAVKYDIAYEWLTSIEKDYLLKELKHTPIQIVVNDGTHAVELYNETDVHNYFDSYDPFRKVAPEFSWPLKIVVTPKPMLKLVILGKEQYILGKDGLAYHIYNSATLQAAFSAGIIGTLTPEPVSSIQDSGKDFVLLTQE